MMIAERTVTVKYLGEWCTVVVTLVGKCYNKLSFNLKHNKNEVTGWYDELDNRIGVKGIEGGLYPLALREYLIKEGIKLKK